MKNSIAKFFSFLTLVSLLTPGISYATSSFSDSFSDETNISQTARVSISGGDIVLQSDANNLTDGESTLLTHLGSDADITTPAVAGGSGGTPTGITYTTDSGGYSGEAAVVTGTNKISFPVSGNLNPLKGTIDFWLSFSTWALVAGKTPDYPNEETIFYVADGAKYIWIIRDWDGKIKMRVMNSTSGLYSQTITTSSYADNSWHHFTIAWNVEEDSPYMLIWVDGSSADKNELADPVPNTFDVNSSFSNSFNPTTFYIGNNSAGTKPLNGKIDELRITSTELSLSGYPSKAGLVTSEAFDTGVASPVWGNIEWSETLPSNKTDIELQVSTSDDGSTWSNWFTQNEAFFTVTFDDGYSGVYDNSLSVMNSFGFTGVPFIVTNYITAPRTTNYMILSEVQALEDAGWEMGSHTSNHLTPTESNLSTSNTWLDTNGFDSNAFAYVGGTFDISSINLVSDYYTTGRTTIPNSQTYNTKFRQYIYSGNSGVSDVNLWIDGVVSKKAWGILNFHSVGQTGTTANVTTEDFTSILQHLSDASVDVLNMRDALVRLGSYSTSTGQQINAANSRYIRYRAAMHSFDGATTPTLSSIKISAPAKIYKDIATTVNADGTFDHATWPQTTDTSIDNLTVTPSSDSVVVTVDTWNTSGTYYKKWTESSTNPAVTTNHTVGDLVAGTYYNVKKDGAVWGTYQANGSGEITFNYDDGYSDILFEVEADGGGPTVSLTAPVDGASVSGSSVVIAADASDDSGIAGVQFKLDTNTNLGDEDTSSPYTSTWDSTTVADGSHAIIAVARDNAGNYATTTANIIVNNTRRYSSGVKVVPISHQTNSSVVFTPDQLALIRSLLSGTSQASLPVSFARSLHLNQVSPSVRQLQQFLNTHGFTVAITGPGSLGQETDYFGRLTQKALGQFQLQNGLITSPQDPAYGYLGPKTRALINGMR